MPVAAHGVTYQVGGTVLTDGHHVSWHPLSETHPHLSSFTTWASGMFSGAHDSSVTVKSFLQI